MHTQPSPFELHAWKEGNRHNYSAGWKGVSPEFGEITLTCPLPRTSAESIVSELRGGLLPTASFETRGAHAEGLVLPALNRSTLRVGERMVYVSRNRFGATLDQRALALRYAGDHYRLAALDKRGYVLSRAADDEDPGVTVTVRETGRGGTGRRDHAGGDRAGRCRRSPCARPSARPSSRSSLPLSSGLAAALPGSG